MYSTYLRQDIALEEFKECLVIMVHHYRSAILEEGREPLPWFISALKFKSNHKDSSLEDFEKHLKHEQEETWISWRDEELVDVSTLAQKKLDNQISDATWAREIENRKERDKQKAIQQIESVYERVLQRGMEHPHERSQLLQLADFLSKAIAQTLLLFRSLWGNWKCDRRWI